MREKRPTGDSLTNRQRTLERSRRLRRSDRPITDFVLPILHPETPPATYTSASGTLPIARNVRRRDNKVY